MNYHIRDIFSSNTITMAPDDGVWSAFLKMKSNSIRHIPIVDAKKKILGIISDRDVLNSIANLYGARKLSDPIISEIMTKDPLTIKLHDAASLGAVMMLNHKIDSLVVTNDAEECVGIVTSYDMLRLVGGN
jgi:acetoin utilization protein AcuB